MSMDIFREDALAGKSDPGDGRRRRPRYGDRQGARRQRREGSHLRAPPAGARGRRGRDLRRGAASAASRHVCDVRDADQVETMMDADLERGPADRSRQQRRREFHCPDEGPQPARLSRRDFHCDGRQLPRHARRRQTLDRGRTQRVCRQQSRDLGLDRVGLRRAFGNGQDGAARHDDVARRRMGPLWHPPQRDRAGAVSDRKRLGEAEPDPRR